MAYATETLTETSWAAVYVAITTTLGTIIGFLIRGRFSRSLKLADLDHSRETTQEASIRQGYEGIIDRLSTEQQRLWAMFNELQATYHLTREACEACEVNRAKDAIEIATLKRRLLALEQSADKGLDG
jgi:hypothetical protein